METTNHSDDLDELVGILSELDRRQREQKLLYYQPYPKQSDFHGGGSDYRERMLSAGNQLGKTMCGSMEMAMHLTGRYPEWWRGRRFPLPIRAWAGGVTSSSTRDTVQKLLLGPMDEIGTGAIPKDCIVNPRPARNIADAIDTVSIKHTAGGYSVLGFKSYEQGRKKWQGETLHVVWLDEEAPMEIYMEALARITSTRGTIYTTFTPLMGMTELAMRFFTEQHPDRILVQMTIEDAHHIAAEERQTIIDGYLDYEREARVNGVPVLGSGRIYPVSESVIKTPAIPIPKHWPRIAAMDFGWEHPTAIVWMAIDMDTDTVYVYDCYAEPKQTPIMHAAVIRAKGSWIPMAWPQDGLQHEKSGGPPIAELYREHGINMLYEPACYEDGSRSVEAGITDILQRMMTYRFKVFDHLNAWFDEFRIYHRREGHIVKIRDDIMDATRYGVMSLRHAAKQFTVIDPYDYDHHPKGSWKTL